MKFRSMNDLYLWLYEYKNFCLGSGAQGTCYKVGNKVFKIFNEYVDRDYLDDEMVYSKSEILRFSYVNNNTYIFPTDVIMVDDIVVGYVMSYVSGKTIDKINPLFVDLDRFALDLEKVYSDVKILSALGIRSFDVVYNIMYGFDWFKIIDTMDYNYSSEDFDNLFEINKKAFNIGIELFLIDGYFDDFIKTSKYLSDMYKSFNADICYFFSEFRKALSMNEGNKISKLCDAKKSLVLKPRDERIFINFK